jgi:hypothetical protein
MSAVYMNILDYALLALGIFLYPTNDVTIPYKRGKSVILGERGM